MLSITKNIGNKITVARVATLGMILALLIVLKYILGFIPGIELITFSFIILGIFLPIGDLLLLVSSFNIAIIIMYGFGPWWFAYWVIWPADALISKGLSKITKNPMVFSIWGFIAGLSVMFWYFISDNIFYDYTFAVLNLITAIPVNLIEGFTTMIMIIIIGPAFIKVLNMYSKRLYPNKKLFVFKEIRNKRFAIFINSLFALSSVAGIVVLFVKNDFFVAWKNKELDKNLHHGLLRQGAKAPDGIDGISVKEYNDIYNSLTDNDVELVIIANHHVYKEKISLGNSTKVVDILDKSHNFSFNYSFHSSTMGYFVGSYKLQGTTQWLHGTSSAKNYGDYYPMYLLNHDYSSLGVSGRTIHPKDIIEISYDHSF